MKALSILQPWAWLIVNGHKDVENRKWPTRVRGPVLIHAGKKWGPEQRDDYMRVLATTDIGLDMPPIFDFENEVGFRGGIVGQANIVGCVTEFNAPKSEWFFGPYGFLLHDAKPLPFRPCRGQLGFFEVPTEDSP